MGLGGYCQDDSKVRISVDLVTAARRHLAFLKLLSDSVFLHHMPTILRSVRRYHELWMPLFSDLSKNSSTVPMFLPPLDVLWVWHCHCLTPDGYRDYCTSRFGRLVERPAIFDDENEEYAINRCRDIWESQYPCEPFDPETSPEADNGCVDDSSPDAGGDLFAIIAKYRTLYSVFSDPFMAETVYLIAARQRYVKLLHLLRQSAVGAARMVPTSDILLMWLTHQSVPEVYAKDMDRILGADKLGCSLVGFGDLTVEDERVGTSKTWEQAFDEPYERPGACFDPRGSPSRDFFYWEEPHLRAAVADSNRKYKALHPRSLMEVCVFLKGRWEDIAASKEKSFIRMRTLKCNKGMKLDRGIYGSSFESWQRMWHMCCELGTKGAIIELRTQGSNCLKNSKLIKSLVFLWNDLLRAPSLTLTKHLGIRLKLLILVTPPVQAPYLLKCVPDRVTDDKGAMISDVILRMNNYHPQDGRWLSRTVLDTSARECFVIRIRMGEGFWRRGAETPKVVRWEDRIIEVREGSWSYVAGSVGTAPQKIVGSAIPREKDLEVKKISWSLSTGNVLTIQWQNNLELWLENEDSAELARLVVGRKLQFEVNDDTPSNEDCKQEEQFVTLIRFTHEDPIGRATALFNWRLLAMEFLPEEDVVFILLLCMAVVLSISEIRCEDVGRLLVRHRIKEATTGIRDWGSVMLPSASSLAPHFGPWFSNPLKVLASLNVASRLYRYSPEDGKAELYKQCIGLTK